jgi:hypothetical protein
MMNKTSCIDYAQKLQLLLWKEVVKLMAERNESHLLNGGDDPMGMTDNQYKGMLLDQLEDWQEVLDLAVEAGNTEIQKKVEKQIAKINEKLKF